MAKLCSSVLLKVELVSDESGYLAGAICKQSVEGTAWFLLAAYSKMQEERDKLKKKLLSKKEPELEDLENSILCLPPIVFWKQITCCFHRFTAEEELCLRMNQTWNLSIFDLDETLNLEFMLE